MKGSKYFAGSQLVYISSYIDNLRYDQPQLKDTLSELHTYTKSTITELRNAIWVMDKEDITLLILAKRIALYLSSLRSIVGNIEIIFKNQNPNKLPNPEKYVLALCGGSVVRRRWCQTPGIFWKHPG